MRPSALLAGVLALCSGVINASPINVGGDTHEVGNHLVARNTTSVNGGTPVEPLKATKISFWASCDACRLTGAGDSLALKCRCLMNNDKDIRWSSLNLNKCIGSNDKGELKWERNGWFTKQCTDVNGRFYKGDLLTGPAKPAIHAKCKAEKPEYTDILGRSTLELYEKIHNYNGNLWCEEDMQTALENQRKDKDGYWGNLRGPSRR